MAVNQSLTLTQVSQDTQNNTSKVRILWTSTQTGGSYNDTSRTAYYYVSANGGSETENAVTYTLPYQSTKTLVDTTVTVQHDSSGNGYITVRTWMNTNISAGVVQLSKSLTLTQIPKESTLTAANAYIGETSRIAVTKKNKAYTHSIAYKFGSLTGYVTASGGISSTEVKFSAETVDFTVPSSFYTAIPSSPSGTCTLTLKTYSGSTQVGEDKTASFTASAKESVCRPALSGTVVDVNTSTTALTGSTGTLVRYHSTARCTVTATAKNSASITQRKANGKTVSKEYLDIANIDTGSFTLYAVVSRGFPNTLAKSCTLIPYIRLTNNASVVRDDPTSGKATLTVKGSCFSGSFGAVSNTLTVKYKIGSGSYVTVTPTVSGSTYSATVALTKMDYELSYTLTVTVEDKLETVTKSLTLGKGLPVFDWDEDDFAFHVPVSMDTPLSMASGGTGSSGLGSAAANSLMLKSPSGAYLYSVNTANGALYATASNGAPKFGTLPIAQGGTGAATASAARSALGAAPAALFSKSVSVTEMDELDEEISTIYSGMTAHEVKFVGVIVNGTYYSLRLWRATDLYGTAELRNYNTDRGNRRRILSAGQWGEWEYDDPPMYVDTEYRTTERWQGKPVYTKLVSFGALPNCTTKSLAHGISVTQILRACGQASNGQTFPICGSGFYNIELRAGLTNIDIYTDYNYAPYTATVQLWYTKS